MQEQEKEEGENFMPTVAIMSLSDLLACRHYIIDGTDEAHPINQYGSTTGENEEKDLLQANQSAFVLGNLTFIKF